MSTIAHQVSVGWSNGGSPLGGKQVTITGNAEVNLSATITSGASNQQFTYALPSGKLQSFFIQSDTAVTFKTNTTTGVNVFTLPGGQSYTWQINVTGTTPPFSADITTIYFTGNGATPSNVDIRALVIDP